jgi:hypothetical protein
MKLSSQLMRSYMLDGTTTNGKTQRIIQPIDTTDSMAHKLEAVN